MHWNLFLNVVVIPITGVDYNHIVLYLKKSECIWNAVNNEKKVNFCLKPALSFSPNMAPLSSMCNPLRPELCLHALAIRVQCDTTMTRRRYHYCITSHDSVIHACMMLCFISPYSCRILKGMHTHVAVHRNGLKQQLIYKMRVQKIQFDYGYAGISSKTEQAELIFCLSYVAC